MPQRQGDDASRRELLALAGPRRDVYLFLAGAFIQPPSLDAVRQFCRPEFGQDLGELFQPETLDPLRRLFAQGVPAEQLQEQIEQEFMKLFKVPSGQYVTPYESVFCDEREIAGRRVKGLLMGPAALDAKRCYRMAAMEISDDFGDLPDHVGLELHFLGRLCGKEVAFAEQGDEEKLTRAREMERDFLAVHLTRWMSKLGGKIRQKARLAYYPAIADMAVEFTERDLATLESVLGESAARSLNSFAELENA